MRRLALSFLLLAAAFTACGRGDDPEPVVSNAATPEALWDHRPGGAQWTKAALTALDSHGQPLVAMVPQDIDAYCPAYPEADRAARKAFWVTFLSALAKHESTWRADVSGGDGAWHGLLQIAPGTAQGYGCVAQNSGDLKDGSLNLACGIRIMAVTVPRDGVISEGMRGVAADWGPFHQASKRSDIQAATRSLPACRG